MDYLFFGPLGFLPKVQDFVPKFYPTGLSSNKCLILQHKTRYKIFNPYTVILYFFILCWIRLLVIPSISAAWDLTSLH